MEQKKFTHLDEFFARAKASEEPVISQEDVRRVLEERDPMQSQTDRYTHFYQRKGFIMSGLGLVTAAAVVGFMTFGSGGKQLAVSNERSAGSGQLSVASDQGPVAHTLSVRGTETAQNSELAPRSSELAFTDPKAQKKVIIINDENTTEVPEPPAPPDAPSVPPLPPDGNLSAPVKVTGIPIYRASSDELKKLALEEKKGTGLGFFVKTGKEKYEKLYIPEKGWGVSMRGETVEKPQRYFSPVVITDAQGNKRMVNFSDDSSVMQYRRYKGSRAMAYAHGSGANAEISDGSVRVTNVGRDDHSAQSKEGTIMQLEDEESNFVVNTSGDSAKHNRTKVISHKIIVNTNDSMHEAEVVNVRDLVEEAMKKAQESLKYSKHDFANGKEINVQLKIDDALKSLDSGSHQLQEVRVMLDSLLRHENMKGMAKNAKVKGMIIVKNKEDHAGATDIRIGEDLPELPMLDYGIKTMEAKISAKINSLIPVLVREASETTHNDKENRDYDDGVIMWFEPTKEFRDAVPAKPVQFVIDGVMNAEDQKPQVQKQNIQSVVPLSNVSIYPNPARTKATVPFVTREPRAVAFSVHDISGKKLLDGGSIAERPAGGYDFELGLEKLSPGLYLIVITTDRGEQSIQRVVVEK